MIIVAIARKMPASSGECGVEPAGDMNARYVDGAAEIVPGAEGVVARMGDDLVKKRLPGREVRIAGQRQQQPIGRVDKGRFFQASRVEAVVALCRRNAPAV